MPNQEKKFGRHSRSRGFNSNLRLRLRARAEQNNGRRLCYLLYGFSIFGKLCGWELSKLRLSLTRISVSFWSNPQLLLRKKLLGGARFSFALAYCTNVPTSTCTSKLMRVNEKNHHQLSVVPVVVDIQFRCVRIQRPRYCRLLLCRGLCTGQQIEVKNSRQPSQFAIARETRLHLVESLRGPNLRKAAVIVKMTRLYIHLSDNYFFCNIQKNK